MTLSHVGGKHEYAHEAPLPAYAGHELWLFDNERPSAGGRFGLIEAGNLAGCAHPDRRW
jgi:hypothetical protein